MIRIPASITIHASVYDPQAVWDRASRIYKQTNLSSSFEELCGERDAPDIGACLQMIFDPGESPPGISIYGSDAQVGEI